MSTARRWKEVGRPAGRFERYLFILSTTAVLALALGAPGPPTDIDSAAYHLSVPLAWLSSGGAMPTPDWFHARLVGLGEALNLLGLAAGTDCFGAVLQASGVIAAIVALSDAGTIAFALLPLPQYLRGALFYISEGPYRELAERSLLRRMSPAFMDIPRSPWSPRFDCRVAIFNLNVTIS